MCSKLKELSRSNQKQRLDYDKNCGVIISSTGLPCLRSLTCKSHSLTSKRKVEGRSKPFDDLLRERNAQISKNSSEKRDSAMTSREDNIAGYSEHLDFKERVDRVYPSRFKLLRRQMLFYLQKPFSESS
jgi:SAGA-associated factor 73